MIGPRSNPHPILPLTSVRLFAALYVVLLHCFLWSHHLDESTWAGRFIRNGYTAVGFFFTLSGFILAHVYLNTDRPFDRRAFWTARFARVYPLLFASLLLDVPREFLSTTLLHTGTVLAGESLLLQAWLTPFTTLNGPSWSVSAEAFFYLLFPFIGFRVWRARRWQVLALFLLLWLGAMTAPALITLRHPEIFAEVKTSVLQHNVEVMPIFRLFEFMAGIALCAFQQSLGTMLSAVQRAQFAWVAITAAALLFVAAIQYSTHVPLLVMSDGFLLPVYGLVILGLVNLRGWVRQILSHRLFVLLGEASYAIYLLHAPLYEYCSRRHALDAPAGWLLYLSLVMIVSIASFLWFERPVRKMILGRLATRPVVTLQQESVALV